MNYVVIVLRLLHIISGVFWVGAALMLTFLPSRFMLPPRAEFPLQSTRRFEVRPPS